MDLQPIFDLAQICYQKGIRHAVISPGSRNAALTIAFARHPKIKCYSVPDERSAAFIALGISLKTRVPTVLICTSGSAALNYAPAVAEAFFNQSPLLLLTADRPPEWIGQRDGQTIFQENVFGRHVKSSFVLPVLEESANATKMAHQITQEAIDSCLSDGMGPVHINVPFREPFYPEQEATYQYKENQHLDVSRSQLNPPAFPTSLSDYKRILIVVGQEVKNQSVNDRLTQLSDIHQIPIVSDIISNTHEVAGAITAQDLFLKNYHSDDLAPDLLITLGLSVISKNLKIYLRNCKPKAHWHVRNEPEAPDTYLALTHHVKMHEEGFLKEMLEQLSVEQSSQEDFYQRWQDTNQAARNLTKTYRSESFSEFNGYKKILESLPSGCDLHLANSMAVRYANVIGLAPGQAIEVYCNRGTSGIDGSNSTALGSALTTDRPTFLLTGDMAFLYDRNAFWHNHVPENLNIVVFNNHGGGIFRMIDGPSQQPELEEFFETRQKKDAGSIATEYNFKYFPCRSEAELTQALPEFVATPGKKILELFTDAEESRLAYKELFRKLSD